MTSLDWGVLTLRKVACLRVLAWQRFHWQACCQYATQQYILGESIEKR